MATLKHINSKNADYGAAEQYLLFEHDEFTMKPVLDETGRLKPREPLQREKTVKTAPNHDGIQRMVDIEAKKAEGKGRGYERWATV